MMLPKKNRLSQAEFKQYKKPAIKENAQSLFVEFTPGNKFKGSVVVSKKVSTKAVVRNRIRRVLYAILSQNCPILPTGTYVVRVKPTKESVPINNLKQDLLKILGTIERKG